MEIFVVAYYITCPSLSEGSEENNGIVSQCCRSLVRGLNIGSAE